MIIVYGLIILLTILIFIPFIKGFLAHNNDSVTDDLKEINRQERLQLLDQTLIQYNKLIDSLVYQYNNETNEKKKAAILKQQIAALEKYNKALERMEKLDK